MKTLYQAANALEAHMILDLIEQQGLRGRVDGEFLQGGIGELPAAGLVRVMVDERDYAAAKAIVDKWDAAQPARETATTLPPGRSRSGMFVLGLLAGVAGAWFYYRVPVGSTGIDHNRDGVPELHVRHSVGGRATEAAMDRNLDGRVDLIQRYARDGRVAAVEADDDFDGVFESYTAYRDGLPLLREIDSNGDGNADMRTHYEHGVAASTVYVDPGTRLPRRIVYFAGARITHADIDTDGDGAMDARTVYDASGAAADTERLPPGVR